jgi:hypothetical protein
MKEKDIIKLILDLGYDINNLTSYKLNLLKFYLKKKDTNIKSLVFNILYNEKSNIPKVLNFSSDYFFRKDIFDNYILYTKKNIPELFLINNKDLKYDLNQINTLFCSKVDFPLYYFRDNIYSLTYELDKIPGNYIEDKQLQINNQVYYLTPFVPIKELENNNIISNKIKGKRLD